MGHTSIFVKVTRIINLTRIYKNSLSGSAWRTNHPAVWLPMFDLGTLSPGQSHGKGGLPRSGSSRRRGTAAAAGNQRYPRPPFLLPRVIPHDLN